MVKPHGTLRYLFFLPGAGGSFGLNPFTMPDDIGNVIGLPGGIPNVPANASIFPLAKAGAGNFGLITIFPTTLVVDPVTGNTLDLVLTVTNGSPAPGDSLVFFLTLNVPMVSDMGL